MKPFWKIIMLLQSLNSYKKIYLKIMIINIALIETVALSLTIQAFIKPM